MTILLGRPIVLIRSTPRGEVFSFFRRLRSVARAYAFLSTQTDLFRALMYLPQPRAGDATLNADVFPSEA